MNNEILMLRETDRIPERSGIRVLDAPFSSACPIHWHDYYTFDIVLSGRGIQTMNGASVPLMPGDISLVHPSDIHSIRPGKDGETILLLSTLFSARAVPDRCRALLRGPCTVLHPDAEITERMTACAREIGRYNRSAESAPVGADAGGASSAEEIGAVIRLYFELLLRLIADCMRRQQDSKAELSRPTFLESGEHDENDAIRAAMRYLDQHFLENPPAAAVGEQIGFSPSYFSTCFRRFVGCTYSEYLLHRRLSYACSLLAAGTSVTEACYASGFGSLSYFSKMFRQHIGVTPGNYRT